MGGVRNWELLGDMSSEVLEGTSIEAAGQGRGRTRGLVGGRNREFEGYMRLVGGRSKEPAGDRRLAGDRSRMLPG